MASTSNLNESKGKKRDSQYNDAKRFIPFEPNRFALKVIKVDEDELHKNFEECRWDDIQKRARDDNFKQRGLTFMDDLYEKDKEVVEALNKLYEALIERQFTLRIHGTSDHPMFVHDAESGSYKMKKPKYQFAASDDWKPDFAD